VEFTVACRIQRRYCRRYGRHLQAVLT
jgi:hypothetical protein